MSLKTPLTRSELRYLEVAQEFRAQIMETFVTMSTISILFRAGLGFASLGVVSGWRQRLLVWFSIVLALGWAVSCWIMYHVVLKPDAMRWSPRVNGRQWPLYDYPQFVFLGAAIPFLVECILGSVLVPFLWTRNRMSRESNVWVIGGLGILALSSFSEVYEAACVLLFGPGIKFPIRMSGQPWGFLRSVFAIVAYTRLTRGGSAKDGGAQKEKSGGDNDEKMNTKEVEHDDSHKFVTESESGKMDEERGLLEDHKEVSQ
ncbi:hypothetical protein B0I35DRAFT_476959 [Stachybotrys elegans]|uniref:Uncharacterized protein n=1 Tax=Stachybotrys elegans TaxID=80388 RepID=A0A8K0T1K7_9HYPO|nr:hypothetical protein B0I35DRAFT_476959 [Stachybotrys elegans]